jgi:hypothetical protein
MRPPDDQTCLADTSRSDNRGHHRTSSRAAGCTTGDWTPRHQRRQPVKLSHSTDEAGCFPWQRCRPPDRHRPGVWRCVRRSR